MCERGVSVCVSLTGLNSEFSFSLTGCHTELEKLSLLYNYPHSWWKNNWMLTFHKVIKFKPQRQGFELMSRCTFPTTTTIAP